MRAIFLARTTKYMFDTLKMKYEPKKKIKEVTVPELALFLIFSTVLA